MMSQRVEKKIGRIGYILLILHDKEKRSFKNCQILTKLCRRLLILSLSLLGNVRPEVISYCFSRWSHRTCIWHVTYTQSCNCNWSINALEVNILAKLWFWYRRTLGFSGIVFRGGLNLKKGFIIQRSPCQFSRCL